MSRKIKLKRILAFALVLIMLSCSSILSAYAVGGDLSGDGTENADSQKVSDASTSGEGGQASSSAETTPDPGTDPITPGTDPAAPGTDPAAPGTDPAAPGTDPAAPGTDPAAPPVTVPGTLVATEPLTSEQTLAAVIYTDDTMAAVSDDAAVITVTGFLPEGGYVTAWPVTVTIDGMQIFAAYDITIRNADGSAFQPDKTAGEAVSVNIDTPRLEDVDTVNVYHVEAPGESDTAAAPADTSAVDTTDATVNSAVEDTVTATVADTPVTATKVADSVAVDDTAVRFDAESFSIYVVASSTSLGQSENSPYQLQVGESVNLGSTKTGFSNSWSVDQKSYGSYSSTSRVALSNSTTTSGSATATATVTSSASAGDLYRIRYGKGSSYDNFYIKVIIAPVSITDTIITDGCLNVAVKDASGTVITDLTGYTFTWAKGGTVITDPNDQQGLLPNGGQSVNVALTDGGLATYTLTVANGSGTVGTATYTVPYDMQLRNGSFENPVCTNWNVQYPNGQSNLIWQTTGPGTGAASGLDIEIARPILNRNAAFNAYGVDANFNNGTADGYQFAELNCEAAGALYQDVLTAPGSSLYWSLYHRARAINGANASSTVDQMYVVVMSADQAQHFKNQTDLVGLISAVNSGSSTYNSYDISSARVWDLSDNASQWYGHNNSGDAYTVSSGQYLTRFFFVAGTTAYEQTHPGVKTIGNFLDDVSFSQQLPYTIEYYVNGVKEAYTDSGTVDPSSNLVNAATEGAHYAALSSQYSLTATKLGYGSSDSNYGVYGSASWYVRDGKTTLRLYFESGAVTVYKTFSGLAAGAIPAGGYTVTFTLSMSGAMNRTATITINQDTFVAGTPYIASFSNVTNGGYTITETVPDASGYSLTGVQGGTASGSLTDITGTKAVNFTVSGTSASVYFANAYTRETTPDTAYLTLRKTFSGVTEAMLTSLMQTAAGNQSYYIQLTRSGEDSPAAILYLSGATQSGQTLTWAVQGLAVGDYTVSETGANTLFDGYSLAGSTGFGDVITAVPTLTYSGVTIPNCNQTQFDNLGSNINLIVVKLTASEGYFVWTDRSLSVGERQAVAGIINGTIGFSPTITDVNTEVAFFSGTDLIQNGFSFRGGSIQYNPSAGKLSMQASKQWSMFAYGTYSGDAVPEIAVTNDYQPGYTLPITGGIGTVWFQVVGTVILAGGAAGLWMELSRGKKRTSRCFPLQAQQSEQKFRE